MSTKDPAVPDPRSINHNEPAEDLTNVYQQALTHKCTFYHRPAFRWTTAKCLAGAETEEFCIANNHANGNHPHLNRMQFTSCLSEPFNNKPQTKVYSDEEIYRNVTLWVSTAF